MSCLSCEILTPIKNSVDVYAQRVFQALAQGSAQIFLGFIALWFVFVVLKMLLRGEFSLPDTVKCFLIYSFIQLALQSRDLYWDYIYRPLEGLTSNIISTIVSLSTRGGSRNSLDGMLEIIESVMSQVFNFTSVMTEDAGFLEKANVWVIGLILKIPFVFFWAIFSVYTLEFMMKLMVVSSLSPLLLIAAGFDKTRGYFFSGIKVVLQGALTVCIAALVMGLMLETIQHTIAQIHPSRDMMEAWQTFSKVFFLGLIAVLFQLKAPNIASNIIGSQDGAGVAGLVAGSIAGGFASGAAYIGSKSATIARIGAGWTYKLLRPRSGSKGADNEQGEAATSNSKAAEAVKEKLTG